MVISATEAREAEDEASKQRLGFAQQLLRADETKAPTSADILRVRRIVQAARERSTSFEALFSENGVQRLFDCGALYFERPSEDHS